MISWNKNICHCQIILEWKQKEPHFNSLFVAIKKVFVCTLTPSASDEYEKKEERTWQRELSVAT